MTPPAAPRRRAAWQELPLLVAVALGLALLVKTLFVQAFFIPSASMERTLHGCTGCRGDRVLVNKLVYDVRSPHRGEIVVFDGDGTGFPRENVTPPAGGAARVLRGVQSFLGLGGGNDNDFIKRVIAVGGDTVSCPPRPDDPATCGAVVVNGVPLDESAYLFEDQKTFFAPAQQPFPETRVPPGRLWVMGDHRDDSDDSRVHGTVPVDKVVGRAFAVVWPPTRFGGLGIPWTFDAPVRS